MVVPPSKSIDNMLDISIEAAKREGYIKTDDLIVFTAGVRINEPGTTNLLQVYCVE
jgi:pyruvate kinase